MTATITAAKTTDATAIELVDPSEPTLQAEEVEAEAARTPDELDHECRKAVETDLFSSLVKDRGLAEKHILALRGRDCPRALRRVALKYFYEKQDAFIRQGAVLISGEDLARIREEALDDLERLQEHDKTLAHKINLWGLWLTHKKYGSQHQLDASQAIQAETARVQDILSLEAELKAAREIFATLVKYDTDTQQREGSLTRGLDAAGGSNKQRLWAIKWLKGRAAEFARQEERATAAGTGKGPSAEQIKAKRAKTAYDRQERDRRKGGGGKKTT